MICCIIFNILPCLLSTTLIPRAGVARGVDCSARADRGRADQRSGPNRRAELVPVLAGLRDAGCALLVITHDLAVAQVPGGPSGPFQEGRQRSGYAIQRINPCLFGGGRHEFIREKVRCRPSVWLTIT